MWMAQTFGRGGGFVDVGLEGVVFDCRACDFRQEVRLLDVVDAMLSHFELDLRWMSVKAANVGGTRGTLWI